MDICLMQYKTTEIEWLNDNLNLNNCVSKLWTSWNSSLPENVKVKVNLSDKHDDKSMLNILYLWNQASDQ